MEDRVDKIINNMLKINKDNLNRDKIKLLIQEIKLALHKNKKTLLETYEVDKKNNNGFMIDYDIIDKIFDNVSKEDIYYGDITLSLKDDDRKLKYGKEILDIGNVVVINDGNSYVIIEMFLKNIMAGNATLFVNDGYMYGASQVIVRIFKHVLEANDISTDLVNIFVTEDYDKVLDNFANINLVVCIGNHELQKLVLDKSKNKVITSGYEHYDLYIEDDSHKELIDKIIATRLDVNIYLKEEINLDYPNATYVMDIEHAIGEINYNGSGYSVAIFTSSTKNAHKFITEVKSKIVTVNTSPTVERLLDIKQSDLVNEKTVIYPDSLKLDENSYNVK